MTNYLLILTANRTILIETYKDSGSTYSSRRSFVHDTDIHFQTINNHYNRTYCFPNHELLSATLIPDSTLNILGYDCQLAHYSLAGLNCIAYYTDVFGQEFSTVAQYPGIALYYEKVHREEKYSFLADWVRPMKLPRSDLYPQVEEQFLKKHQKDIAQGKSKAFGQRPSLRSYDARISPNITRRMRSRGYFGPPKPIFLSFKDSYGNIHRKQKSKNKVIVIQTVEHFERETDTKNQEFLTISKEFKNDSVLFISMSYEKAKHISSNNVGHTPTITFVPNAKKVFRQNLIKKDTGYLIINPLGDIRFACDLELDDLRYILSNEIKFALEDGNLPAEGAKHVD